MGYLEIWRGYVEIWMRYVDFLGGYVEFLPAMAGGRAGRQARRHAGREARTQAGRQREGGPPERGREGLLREGGREGGREGWEGRKLGGREGRRGREGGAGRERGMDGWRVPVQRGCLRPLGQTLALTALICLPAHSVTPIMGPLQ